MWIKVISVLIIVVRISVWVEEVVLSVMHGGFVMNWGSVVDWGIWVNLNMDRCMSWSLVMYRCDGWVCNWS